MYDLRESACFSPLHLIFILYRETLIFQQNFFRSFFDPIHDTRNITVIMRRNEPLERIRNLRSRSCISDTMSGTSALSPTFPSFYRVSPEEIDGSRVPFIRERFVLDASVKEEIRKEEPSFGFGEFGKAVYYRTYSRRIVEEDGSERQEHWPDTVIRVIEGVFGIRKDYLLKHSLEWREEEMQKYAKAMALSLFRMEWLPPGRGLWACGTGFVYERGAAALNNCGFTRARDLAFSMVWTADMLMCGCGVGVYLDFEGDVLRPDRSSPLRYEVPDNREGWAHSVGLLISAYVPRNGVISPFPVFDYSRIRSKGTALRGFGGTASGPTPLIELHQRLEAFFETYLLAHEESSGRGSTNPFLYLIRSLRNVESSQVARMSQVDFKAFETRMEELHKAGKKVYDKSRLVADVANSIGVCVVAGNVRRSAMILLGDVGDRTFMDLKNFDINPERGDISWMSNNTVVCKKTEDFDVLPEIARRVVANGEPGFYNLINTKRYGRYGKVCRDPSEWTREFEEDQAIGLNPCITGDTMVLTNQGLRRADKLVGNAFVAVVDGHEYPSTPQGFWSTGKKEVYRITLDNGIVVRATSNHKFLVKKSVGLFEWREVSTFMKGNVLALGNNVGYKWAGGEGTHDEGYFLGQVIGDGYVDGEVPVACLWVPPDQDINAYKPAITMKRYAMSLRHRSDFKGFHVDKRTDVYVKYSMKLVETTDLAKKWGVERIEKKVPENGSYDFTVGLLRGFFDADGTVLNGRDKGVSVRLAQVNLSRLEAVQRLLNAMGIMSRIYKNRRPAENRLLPDGRGGSKEYHCQTLHELVITRQDIIRFRDIIGFLDDGKMGKLNKSISQHTRGPYRSKYEANVSSVVKEDELQEVFDCTIEQVHRFWAGGVVSHNCSESCMEDKELCNLSEIFPTRCKDASGSFSTDTFLQAVEYATFYATTVSLLPTHWPCSNEVIARNRRIGVSLSGIADFYDAVGFTALTKILRKGYKKVRCTNRVLSREAGVPESIRVTVVKPSGTIAQIVGVSSGIHFPTFKYALRRMRMGQDSHIATTMIASDYPYEEDTYSPNTLVVEFPIDQGKTRKATEVSMWEQISLASTLQREWADNSVSVTIYFNPETEAHQVEWALAQAAPTVKALSFLPHTPGGVYVQSPYEELTREQYETRLRSVKAIDWGTFGLKKSSDGECPKFCTNDSCLV